MPFWNSHCQAELGLPNQFDCMTEDWIRLALTNAGFLHSTLLIACRELSKNCPQQQASFVQQAYHHKAASARALADSMTSATFFDDATIANVLTLAMDEVSGTSQTKLYCHVLIVFLAGSGKPQGLVAACARSH